jgi:hypothetical protein
MVILFLALETQATGATVPSRSGRVSVNNLRELAARDDQYNLHCLTRRRAPLQLEFWPCVRRIQRLSRSSCSTLARLLARTLLLVIWHLQQHTCAVPCTVHQSTGVL